MNRPVAYAAFLVAALLSACTNLLPPADRMRLNISKSTFELCDALTVAVLAPSAVRAEWRYELDRRGATCSSYAQERADQDAKDAAALRRVLSNVGRAAAAAQRDDATDAPTSAPKYPSSCLKKSEVLRGNSRHCIFDCTGTEVIQTVSSIDLCPLSISR